MINVNNSTVKIMQKYTDAHGLRQNYMLFTYFNSVSWDIIELLVSRYLFHQKPFPTKSSCVVHVKDIIFKRSSSFSHFPLCLIVLI